MHGTMHISFSLKGLQKEEVDFNEPAAVRLIFRFPRANDRLYEHESLARGS